MRIKIRTGVFETNSSSMHSIAIPKECDISELNDIYFSFGEFGWEFEEVNNWEYLYTAIYECYSGDELSDVLNKLINILEKNNISYHFKDYYNRFHSQGYIDHGYELKDFLDDMLNNEEKLLRYLCGGRVFTGNDNDGDYGRVHRDKSKCFSEDSMGSVDNPYYIGEGYDWYFK